MSQSQQRTEQGVHVRDSEGGVQAQTCYRILSLCLTGFPCLPLHDLYPTQTCLKGRARLSPCPGPRPAPLAQPSPARAPENGEQGPPSGEGTFAWNTLLLPSIGPVPAPVQLKGSSISSGKPYRCAPVEPCTSPSESQINHLLTVTLGKLLNLSLSWLIYKMGPVISQAVLQG